jgi:hypothetical protein
MQRKLQTTSYILFLLQVRIVWSVVFTADIELEHMLLVNRYLYPDRYINMIPYYIYLHLWSITYPVLKMFKELTICWNWAVCCHMLDYTVTSCDLCKWPRIGIYVVIDMHCLSQCYVGGNSCKYYIIHLLHGFKGNSQIVVPR